jgi:two-component system, OmpR family, alkaline phosphatase synthesis response regulator PhoP
MTAPTVITRILVVDDDEGITRLLRAYLEQAKFQVILAHDAKTAHQVLHEERPHLMILDLMLPDGDGWEITRSVRTDPILKNLPVLMLTARIEDSDKLLGLELGADDYITKPFNPHEVVARVRAVLRRTQVGFNPDAYSVLQCGKLRMDIVQHEVKLDDQPVELTPTEFELLRTLMENPGYVFTRSTLIERSLGYDYESLERTLDTHIKNLRRKIEPDPKQPLYIQTVYGIGYRLEKQN